MDAFFDKLDLQKLGFTGTVHKSEGRPPHAPGVLLKLYLYGYLNKIRSSRKLEKECNRNTGADELQIKKERITQGLAKLKERTIKYDNLQEKLNNTDDKQISTTDTDSRSILVTKAIVEVAYNTQNVVDDKYNLIVHTKATKVNTCKKSSGEYHRL